MAHKRHNEPIQSTNTCLDCNTVCKQCNHGHRIHWPCLISIIATLEMWWDHLLEEILHFWLGLWTDWLIFWLHVT